MHIKFKITFEDDTTLESHDAMWNIIKDHSHALPPYINKKWKRYELISDDMGFMVGVDFETGLFNIRGQIVHMGDEGGGSYTFRKDLQNFPVDEARKLLNNLPYFPVYGRRQIMGDWGGTTLFFCGWKRKDGDKTIQKTAVIYPNGQIVLT